MPVNKDIWTKCHNSRVDASCDCVHCHYAFMRRHRIARRTVMALLGLMGLGIIVGIARFAA